MPFDPVDIHVGARVRVRRREIGMNQIQLGKAVGMSYQQIQKDERGVNRIACSTLVRIASALGVSTSYFFEGIDPASGPEAELDAVESTMLFDTDTRELVRGYILLDKKTRKVIHTVVLMMAEIGV